MVIGSLKQFDEYDIKADVYELVISLAFDFYAVWGVPPYLRNFDILLCLQFPFDNCEISHTFIPLLHRKEKDADNFAD